MLKSLHTHPLEIVALISAFVSFLIVGRMFYSLVRHELLELIRQGQNGPMRFKTVTDVLNQAFLLVMATSSLVACGLFQHMEPPPPSYDLLPQTVSSMLLITWFNVLITSKSIMRVRRRSRLGQLLQSDPYRPMPGGKRSYDPPPSVPKEEAAS